MTNLLESENALNQKWTSQTDSLLCSDFNEFLTLWKQNYQEQISAIDIFNPDLTAHWSLKQKQLFVSAFYHARGHFNQFLWLLGNEAPDKLSKEIILHNIREEFGDHRLSHENLYHKFSKYFGVDTREEFLYKKNYFPFLKLFNQGHLEWLLRHDWNGKLSAFSAYEKLDNIDYPNLLKLAKSLETPDSALIFFQVHIHVKHFETTIRALLEVWEKDARIVKEAFSFIGSHQIAMWKELSSYIFGSIF